MCLLPGDCSGMFEHAAAGREYTSGDCGVNGTKRGCRVICPGSLAASLVQLLINTHPGYTMAC